MNDLIARARRLRIHQTKAEHRFWALLHPWRMAGFHFRRQSPIGPYIVDFVCKGRTLVIEIDGDTHFADEAGARDEARTEHLAALGYRVLRFTNRDVLDNPSGVHEIMAQILGEPTPT